MVNGMVSHHPKKYVGLPLLFWIGLALPSPAATPDENLRVPGPAPAPASLKSQAGGWTLESHALRASFSATGQGLRLDRLDNLLTGETLAWPDPNLFTLRLEGREVPSSAMTLKAPPSAAGLTAAPSHPRLAERLAGQSLTCVLEDDVSGLRVAWSAILRDGSNALRQELVVSTSRPCRVEEIELLHAEVPGAVAAGYTDGSPVVAGNWFMGLEHPMAITRVTPRPAAAGNLVTSFLPRRMMLQAGESWVVSVGIGAAPRGQMRRAFAFYLQRERARPYHQYWHYNSWYDLNIGRNENPDPVKRMSEEVCLGVVKTFGEELFRKRGVALDGYVWDDGWDDWNTLWGFHRGFPNGFKRLMEEQQKQHAGNGVWLSPFGGYGQSHTMRTNYGRKQGYETNATGFSLGGPKYYAAFRDACLGMIRDQGANYFKFDGIGAGAFATGAPPGIAADLDSIVRLMDELRAARPDVFINATTGMWPSPYWLRFADSIWRGGEDTAFAGKGNPREQWINYKDGVVYDRVASRSPLFPVGALMYGGIVLGPTHNPGRMPPPAGNPASFRHEVRMAAGYACGLGELYLSPALMTPEAWDAVAESIRWARARKEVLADSHWIGGDVRKHQVYGLAAWQPGSAERSPCAIPTISRSRWRSTCGRGSNCRRTRPGSSPWHRPTGISASRRSSAGREPRSSSAWSPSKSWCSTPARGRDHALRPRRLPPSAGP
ncbi:MAG: enterotoxin [Kiritimatiellia bacterium]